jgi:hypothetical protein
MIKSRRMSWEGHVAHTGGKRNAFEILVGGPELKRLHGIPRHRVNIILKCVRNVL